MTDNIAGRFVFAARHYRCTINWSLKSGRFSMEGTLYEDGPWVAAGQCHESIADAMPDNPKLARILAIWQRWHLNDLLAGSPAQLKWVRQHPEQDCDYVKLSAALAEAGLNPDPGLVIDGKPYAYGSKWLREELPPEVVAEIQSWEASKP